MVSYSTLTSKGQMTLPKDIRDRLALSSGDQVVWTVVDNLLVGTPKNLDFADIAGILGNPPNGPATLDEIDAAVREAVARHVVGEDAPDDREHAA